MLFRNSLAFSMIQQMLAIWSLVPLPFLKPAWILQNRFICTIFEASQVALMVKTPPVNAGDVREAGLIPGSGESTGQGHGCPLQYSCLENPMAWQGTVHGVTKSQTWPKWLSMHVQRSWIFGIIFKPREHGHSTVNEQELGSNSIPPTSYMVPIKLLTLYEPYFPLICNRRFWPHTNLKELFRGVKEIKHVHYLA